MQVHLACGERDVNREMLGYLGVPTSLRVASDSHLALVEYRMIGLIMCATETYSSC